MPNPVHSARLGIIKDRLGPYPDTQTPAQDHAEWSQLTPRTLCVHLLDTRSPKQRSDPTQFQAPLNTYTKHRDPKPALRPNSSRISPPEEGPTHATSRQPSPPPLQARCRCTVPLGTSWWGCDSDQGPLNVLYSQQQKGREPCLRLTLLPMPPRVTTCPGLPRALSRFENGKSGFWGNPQWRERRGGRPSPP